LSQDTVGLSRHDDFVNGLLISAALAELPAVMPNKASPKATVAETLRMLRRFIVFSSDQRLSLEAFPMLADAFHGVVKTKATLIRYYSSQPPSPPAIKIEAEYKLILDTELNHLLTSSPTSRISDGETLFSWKRLPVRRYWPSARRDGAVGETLAQAVTVTR
jgi:hypothetical protein